MKKIGIIGNGQLGNRAFSYFSSLNEYTVRLYSKDFGFDLKNFNNIQEIVSSNDIIINCAAMTNVNECGKNVESENEAMLINAIAPNVIAAEVMKSNNKKFVHISTDYVYGDEQIKAGELRFNCESDECTPVNFYGLSKLTGDYSLLKTSLIAENRLLILRPSCLYDYEGSNSIIARMYKMMISGKFNATKEIFSVPTECILLCEVMDKFFKDHLKAGIYNIRNEIDRNEKVSMYDIALYMLKLYSEKTKNNEIILEELPSIDNLNVKRQHNSMLSIKKLQCAMDSSFNAYVKIRHWHNAIDGFINYKISQKQ